MKKLRLTINWLIILSCPVWITIYAFFKSFAVAHKELKKENKDYFLEGNKFFWD